LKPTKPKTALIGTWEETFTETLTFPSESIIPEDNSITKTVTFLSRLSVTDISFRIEVREAGADSGRSFVLEYPYEISADTLILFVSRGQNPPKLTGEPYRFAVWPDSLYLETLPQEIEGLMVKPATGYPWWIGALYRDMGGPESGTFYRKR
jgi:hypothetical protein